MAKVCTGNLQGIKTYLAEDGDINVRLTASELDVLHRELGGDPCRGNPSFARQVEAVEVDDTALHIAVRSGDKDIVKYLLSHGAEMHVPNGSGETAACLGDKCCVDVRSNFKLEARIEEIFDVIDENKDGWINEPEAIKFALLTTDNDEENAYTFWRVLQSTQGGSPTGLVSKATWVSFFLSHFAGAQVAVALSQLQEVLDQISLIRGQAIGQTMLASRTTPLRTINNVHWVSGIRSSWAPGDRRVTAESFRPRSTGHPFVPLFF